MPGVSLRPFERSISELWRTAPTRLRKRASRPFTPEQRAVWEVFRDHKRLGTEAVPNVPLWIDEHELGYVLDFLLPEYGLNVQIDRWEPSFDEEEPPDVDIDAEPDHPYNEERKFALLECRGIESVHFWDDVVREFGGEEICAEVRKELGFGRPPWLTRMEGSLPSRIAPA